MEVQDFKISLITAVYNAENTIARCIESVIAQNYKNLEYIIIDGGSTDHTLQIIDQYKDHINIFISEPDNGVYDAMNKGIKHASGHVVGTLNADDFFAANDVLAAVSKAFTEEKAAILYGNLNFLKLNGKVFRKWTNKLYTPGLFGLGWMPPHPTFYCKRQLFEQLGYYSLEYGTAGDYELMLRFMHRNNFKVYYLNKLMVNMQRGGMSNKFPTSRIRAWRYDLKAMKTNSISYPWVTLLIKPLRKLLQYL